MGSAIISVAILGQMFNAPLLQSICICYRRLGQEQRKAVGPLRGCLLHAVIGGEHQRFYLINWIKAYSARRKSISQLQFEQTYHISVLVFREVQMQLHCNEFLFFHDELKSKKNMLIVTVNSFFCFAFAKYLSIIMLAQFNFNNQKATKNLIDLIFSEK